MAAHHFFLQAIQRVAHFGHAAFELLGEVLFHFLLHLFFARVALCAVEGFKHPAHFVHGEFAHRALHVLARQIERELALGLADFRLDALDEGHDLLDFFMREEDRLEHHFFGNFLRAGFHHHHGVLGARHGEGQFAGRALFVVRVDDELAIDQADVDRAGGPGKGNIRNAQRGGGANHGRDFRRVVGVHGHGDRHHLHVVAHAFGEQGAQRTVDQAAGEDRLFGRPAFALDETAGNLADGIQLLFKIHAQREKVDAIARLVRRGSGHEQHRIAIADEGRAIRLLGILAELQHELAPAQFHFILLEHLVVPPLDISSLSLFLLLPK